MPSPPSPFIKDISRVYFKRKRLPYRDGRVEIFFQLNIDVEATFSVLLFLGCINDVYSTAKWSSKILSFYLVLASRCKKLIY